MTNYSIDYNITYLSYNILLSTFENLIIKILKNEFFFLMLSSQFYILIKQNAQKKINADDDYNFSFNQDK